MGTLSFSAGGDATWYSHFGTQSESYETKLFSWDLAIELLGIYPKQLKTCPHKYLHMNGNSSFIHKKPKLGNTEMSFSRRIDDINRGASRQWNVTQH